MADSLKGLDKLILEVLQESNLIEREMPVTKEKKIEAVAYPKLGITENWGKPGNKTPDLIRDIFGKIEGKTICAFGEAVAWPVQSFIEHFRDEFEFYCKHGYSKVTGPTHE